MRLSELKRLYGRDKNLVVQIHSNSYSGYCIRIKQGEDYQTLKGWFGRLKQFNSVEEAKDFLQANTSLQHVFLAQSLAQDEVDMQRELDHDLHREEELGCKVDLHHE